MATVTFPSAIGGNNSTVDDTDSPTTGLKNGGHRTRFVAALAQFVAVATFGVTKATEAAASAVNAAASAASAAASAGTAAGFIGASVTSNTVGTGSKSFTIQTGRNFTAGVWVSLVSAATPANAMFGTVTSYNSGTGALVVNVLYTTGSGTAANWVVSLSGPRGQAGSDATVTSGNIASALGYTPANAASVTGKASASDLRGLTEDTKWLTAKSVGDALAFVPLTDAATIAIDLGAGVNFSVTLGGNRTLGAPSNAKPGQTGVILVKQDGTGSRTLAYNAAWVPFGSLPTLTTTAGKVDLLTYLVETSGKVRFSSALNGAA